MNDRQWAKLRLAQAQHWGAIDTLRYLREIVDHDNLHDNLKPETLTAVMGAIEIGERRLIKTARRLDKVERRALR